MFLDLFVIFRQSILCDDEWDGKTKLVKLASMRFRVNPNFMIHYI